MSAPGRHIHPDGWDLKALTIEQLEGLLGWFDGNEWFTEECDELRAEIARRMGGLQ